MTLILVRYLVQSSKINSGIDFRTLKEAGIFEGDKLEVVFLMSEE